jgi:nucleoside-diphosphate-sugar epimerase
MRVLVVGGTVFIGPPVVRRLVALGHKVTLFHRGEHEHDDLSDVVHIHGDRAQTAAFADEFARQQPDVVLDMRPMTERDARSLLTAVRGATRRIVAVSSVDVYRAYGRLHGSEPGGIEPMPITEESPLREQLYPYRGEREDAGFDDYDKIPVERAYLGDREIAGTIVRLPAVHGEGDYQHRLMMELLRFDAGRPFVLYPAEAEHWRWPRAYVGNVAEAIVLAVADERAAGRIYNAPCDPPLTQPEWLRACGDQAGWRGDVIGVPAVHLPQHLAQPVNYAQSMVIDSARIREELGYNDPFTTGDGIARAIAWERAHPPKRMQPEWSNFSLDDAALAAVHRS